MLDRARKLLAQHLGKTPSEDAPVVVASILAAMIAEANPDLVPVGLHAPWFDVAHAALRTLEYSPPFDSELVEAVQWCAKELVQPTQPDEASQTGTTQE